MLKNSIWSLEHCLILLPMCRINTSGCRQGVHFELLDGPLSRNNCPSSRPLVTHNLQLLVNKRINIILFKVNDAISNGCCCSVYVLARILPSYRMLKAISASEAIAILYKKALSISTCRMAKRVR
jgi:hypothetical protein